MMKISFNYQSAAVPKSDVSISRPRFGTIPEYFVMLSCLCRFFLKLKLLLNCSTN